MGTEAESRLNYMVMIDFNFAVRMEGINVNYVLDAEDVTKNIMMNTMYVMALISFSLATVLVTLIWLRARRMLFYVCSIAIKVKLIPPELTSQ